ncbi:MAG TPA: hypothetical protein DCS63_04455 [Elusimicrobia bacterium]|nr:hypothetical protein [Elusimicrobiota bacterium]
MNRAIKVFLPGLLICAAVSSAAAEENKISQAADKAAAQLLGSMKDCFTDLTNIQAMTPQQKVDYILKTAETRVKEQTEKTAKEALQKKLEDYAEKVLTARAVKDIAIPQMLTAIETGIPYPAAEMERKVAETAGKQMKALTTGIEGAKITWEVMRKTRDEGPLEGFKELSATIYDKVAEAYIPGYSWIKLGAELTKALVSYVMGYATETAKMAMFSVMYPEYAGDPAAFGKWLIKTSEREIGLDVARRWDEEGVEFAQYLWEGKGTDSGAVQMRERLRAFLFEMRRDIDAKTKKQREAQKAMEDRLQKAYDDMNNSKAALRDATRQAMAAAEEKLKKIEEFKGTYLGYSAIEERAQEVADENKTLEVSARASYFNFGLKLEDMKEEIRGKYFNAPWTDTGSPDVQTYYDRVDAEWENVKKNYDGEAKQFHSTYGSRSDGLSNRTLSLFGSDTAKYQQLSQDEYTAITAQVKSYIAFLDAESKATERPLAAEVNRIANVLRGLADEGSLLRLFGDVVQAPDSPGYAGTGTLDFPKNALPEPRLRQGQAGYFDLYKNTLNDRAYSIAIEAAPVKYKIEDFDYVLRYMARSPEIKLALQENLADIAAVEARISQAELPLHIRNTYLYPEAGLKAEEVGYDQLFRATALSGAKSQNKSMTAELAKAVALGDTLKAKRERWQADLESMQADIARLKKQAGLLAKGETAIAEAAAGLSKKRTGDYTEYCAPQAPKDYFVFNGVKEPSCRQLLTTSSALMNQGEAQTAKSGFVNAVRASGVFALDTQYNLGLEAFVTAMQEDYFKDAYFPKNYIFIPFEKKCCFYTADYFTEEAAKMKSIKIESDDSAEGALFRGRLITKLYKSAAYDHIGVWGEDLPKADAARFLTLTAGAFDSTVKQSIHEFCAAIDTLKEDYTAYLLKQASDAVYDKEANALSIKIREAETEANNKLDTASWEKVAAFETEVLAFETKYKAADISAGMKANLAVNVDSMKSRIATAKQNTKLVITDKPVVPSGPPGSPSRPVDQPGIPVKPVDQPSGPVVPPAKPVDKPARPENPPAIPATPDPNIGAIKMMYADFIRAYESKNESQVLRYISPNWDAGDGTGISELSGYLRNIFTVFNEVRCTNTDLRVIKKTEGVYKATYNMVITGRIFDQNIKHEEKSSVEEEVTLNERGKPVISKTIKGNFWSFE